MFKEYADQFLFLFSVFVCPFYQYLQSLYGCFINIYTTQIRQTTDVQPSAVRESNMQPNAVRRRIITT